MHKLIRLKKIKTGTEYLHLYRGEYDMDGQILSYEIVSRKDAETMFGGQSLGHGVDAVYIIPFFANGDVLATKEFRYATNTYCLEFPAGLIEPRECAVDAAIRELKEETGLDTKKVLFSIPGGFSSAGMTDEKVAVVGLEVSGQFRDSHGKEEIHCFRTTIEDLWERVKNGEECSSRMQCFLLGWNIKEEEVKKQEEARDIFDEIAGNLRDYPEGEIWSIGNEILCKTKSAADAIVDMLETMYRVKKMEDVQVYSGYYDPVEDKRNGEEDWCTGWWYVNIG